jgi:hypothetical protein
MRLRKNRLCSGLSYDSGRCSLLDHVNGFDWGSSIKTVKTDNNNIYQIYFGDGSLELLQYLQNAHDYSFDIFEVQFNNIKESFNIT